MPVDRATFSESWYRVANLCPRLRFTVQVSRQHFRGRMWHVVQDPASNQFFRLNESAYRFVAMLDGQRTVAQVWRTCNEQMGDEAPTQGEAIQLLGQLYTSNLLQVQLPPDAEGLLRRYRKRRAREIQGYITNLLFIRIPLIDPDHFLDRWVGLLGRAFTAWGFALWAVLVAAGVYCIVGRGSDLADRASGVFNPANLPLLYVALVVAKVLHEFGHAFACKTFGRRAGSGGEVHVMGVMFLVFMPLPYVDASSAWAFRRKWRRVMVGAAGMIVELGVAAVAAIVWAGTRQGATAHAVAYNIMFIASVSTLLFNGNPLLRYDAYYILSDLLEIPNLAQRSRQYIYYLVKRYAWGVRRAVNPAHTRGERAWFAFYGVASTVYRVFIFAMILLFLTDRLPKFLAAVAIAFGAVAAFTWLCVPLGRLVRYLAVGGELARVRGRAVLTTIAFAAALLACVAGPFDFPDRCRVEGFAEPMHMAFIHAAADGFVREVLPSGRTVGADGPPLLVCVNPDLLTRHERLLADRRRLQVERRVAQTQEVAGAQVLAGQLAALDRQILRVREQLVSLAIAPPLSGTWITPDADRLVGAYLSRGDRVGLVADERKLVIRAAAGQQLAAMLIAEANRRRLRGDIWRVQIRVKGRPDLYLTGVIVRILPAGQEQLPSAALGYAVGGTMQTALDDPAGTKAAEPFFEIRVVPDEQAAARLGTAGGKLRSGQRVVVRIEMPPKSLAKQWWRSLWQLLQRRLRI